MDWPVILGSGGVGRRGGEKVAVGHLVRQAKVKYITRYGSITTVLVFAESVDNALQLNLKNIDWDSLPLSFYRTFYSLTFSHKNRIKNKLLHFFRIIQIPEYHKKNDLKIKTFF